MSTSTSFIEDKCKFLTFSPRYLLLNTHCQAICHLLKCFFEITSTKYAYFHYYPSLYMRTKIDYLQTGYNQMRTLSML